MACSHLSNLFDNSSQRATWYFLSIMFTYFVSTPWGGKIDYLMELVFADKDWQIGAITDKGWWTFCTPGCILESITVCRVLRGGNVKEAPSVSFSMPYFFRKRETGRLQPELYSGTVGRSCEAVLILYLGGIFQYVSVRLQNRGSSPRVWGPPRSEFPEFL